MKTMRDYILRKFKYKELGISFTKKMRGAIDSLKQFPKGYTNVGLIYKGYYIYLKSSQGYLFFYIINEEENKITLLRVLQEGMNWRKMIEEWIVEN